MKNIFKDAYFGKPYKTKNEKKALYIHHYKDSEDGDMHYLIIDGSVTTYVWGADGKIAPNYNNSGLDIVSEWEETIDEEELDRLAEEYSMSNYGYTGSGRYPGIEDFKAGYMKRVEEEK